MVTCFLDCRQVHEALKRARDGLSISANSSLTSDEVSVFFKYLLLTEFGDDEAQYRRINRYNMPTLVARLEKRLSDVITIISSTDGDWKTPDLDWASIAYMLRTSQYYCHRLIDLALEALVSEPLAPERCIALIRLSPHDFSANLKGVRNHAVIFSAPVCFSHEMYPLIADACGYDSGYLGYLHTNILGAHIDWLTADGKLNRIIYFDFDAERLIETDLEVPVSPDSVQFLCLGEQEQEKHAAFSERFNCVQVNPATVSRLADDKAATLFGWAVLGLEVPDYKELAPGDFATASGFLESYAEIAVKPNQASEGKHVAFFQHSDSGSKALLASHLKRCWEQGTAIIQQRRDGICFRNPASGLNQTLVLRLNLAFDGEHYCLESGYAQLGRDERHPASCGRGGQIVLIDEALSSLACGNQPIRLEIRDWNGIREKAERAASLFDGLMLMGLDVLLDYDRHGKIIPVFLEANPRPAGLSHSKLLSGNPFEPSQTGVSLKLWAGISRMQFKESSAHLS